MGFKFNGLSPQIKEAVAAFEAFARLGFRQDRIGVAVALDGQGLVTLHHEGEQFNIFVGPLMDIMPDQFVGRWREAIKSKIQGTYDLVSFEELLNQSQIWGQMEQLITNLIKRGFLSHDPRTE